MYFSTYLLLFLSSLCIEQIHVVVTMSSVKLRPNQTLHPCPGVAGHVAAFIYVSLTHVGLIVRWKCISDTVVVNSILALEVYHYLWTFIVNVCSNLI